MSARIGLLLLFPWFLTNMAGAGPSAEELLKEAATVKGDWEGQLQLLHRASDAPFKQEKGDALELVWRSGIAAPGPGGVAGETWGQRSERELRTHIEWQITHCQARLGRSEEVRTALLENGNELLESSQAEKVLYQLSTAEVEAGISPVSEWLAQVEKAQGQDLSFRLKYVAFVGARAQPVSRILTRIPDEPKEDRERRVQELADRHDGILAREKLLQATRAAFDLAKKEREETTLVKRAIAAYLRACRGPMNTEERAAHFHDIMTDESLGNPARSMAAYELPYLLKRATLCEDERLWAWIADRPVWENADKKIVGAMMRASKGEQVAICRRRAEALALEAPGRFLVMGEVLLGQDYPEHAAMFLKRAVTAASDEERAKELLARAEAVLESK